MGGPFREHLDKFRPEVVHFFHLRWLGADRFEEVSARGIPTHLWGRVWSWIVVAFLLSLPATLLVAPDHRKLWIGWFWVPWSYLFATSSVEYALGRYNIAITPPVVVQTILAFGLIANAWRQRLRRECLDG